MSQNPRHIRISLTLSPAVERTYLRIPFDVLSGTERLTIRYSYPRHREDSSDPACTFRDEVNIVDLALEDGAHALVGASGSERTVVVIGENHATDGYRPAPLVPGTWHVVLGAYVIDPDGCPVVLEIEQEANHPVLIEVWNGPFTLHNMKAVGYWQQQLSEGRRLPVLGGSDNHRSDQFLLMGNPTTFAYADSRSGSALLAALRAGHTFIGSTPDAPVIDLAAGPARMGDVLHIGDVFRAGDADSVVLHASRLRPEDEIRFITETGIVHRRRITREYAVRIELPLPNAKFMRIEVWRPIPGLTETLAALGNPIYFER